MWEKELVIIFGKPSNNTYLPVGCNQSNFKAEQWWWAPTQAILLLVFSNIHQEYILAMFASRLYRVRYAYHCRSRYPLNTPGGAYKVSSWLLSRYIGSRSSCSWPYLNCPRSSDGLPYMASPERGGLWAKGKTKVAASTKVAHNLETNFKALELLVAITFTAAY